MINKSPRYEILTMKIAMYKVVFRKYPVNYDKTSSIYSIDIWKKENHKDRKSGYDIQVLHEENIDNDYFKYDFSSEGMWDCLNDYIEKDKESTNERKIS